MAYLPVTYAALVHRRSMLPLLATTEPSFVGEATKTIVGVVRDSNSDPVVGATVLLFRQHDNRHIATVTSGALGAYTFVRTSDDLLAYYVVAFTIVGGTTEVHGVSNRDLVPS